MSTKIGWTDKVWNPVIGCTPVSEGCRNCYAARQAYRQPFMAKARRKVSPYAGLTRMTEHGTKWTGEVRCLYERLDQPFRWRKPRRVFVDSMSDLFHPEIPEEFIARAWTVMAQCHWHTFQVLTKRPERMQHMIERRLQATIHAMCLMPSTQYCGDRWPLPNVWIGYSASTQKDLDAGVPHLLQTPAAVRFLSLEPLLGPVSITDQPWWDWRHTYPYWKVIHPNARPPIDWVIVGGESGPGARPCNIDWIRSIVQQCKAAGVACFVKQLGAHYIDEKNGVGGAQAKPPAEYGPLTRQLKHRAGADSAEWPDDLRVQKFPEEPQ